MNQALGMAEATIVTKISKYSCSPEAYIVAGGGKNIDI